MHPEREKSPKAKRPKVKDKELDAMIQSAWDAGWWCRYTGKGHVMCYSPDGEKMVSVANTPSDHRTVPNTRKYFRRSGLTL
jgi:hypothetical protein